jgi:hypothetical protein
VVWCGPSKVARDDARLVLLTAGFKPDMIVDVDTDAIVWVDFVHRGHTAWLTRTADGKMRVFDELGFQIDRPKTI